MPYRTDKTLRRIRPSKLWRRFAFASIALVVAAFSAFWFQGKPFDRSFWNDELKMRDGIRLKMADRLVARRTLHGKTKEEVLALLGVPPETGYFKEWSLVYWLGPQRGFLSIDSEWLVMRIGSNGRVSEVKIVTE